jgi:hypothetical protein
MVDPDDLQAPAFEFALLDRIGEGIHRDGS